MPSVWLVLPTFNEAENIEPIVRAALPHLASTGLPHRILVVDDNSPDGTGAIADRLAGEIDELEVMHRERKEGIGPAYLAGFAHALADGADLLLEMDSDFSHDPGRPAAPDRRHGRGRPGAGLALRPGRRRDRLGPRAPPDQQGRIALRASSSWACR